MLTVSGIRTGNRGGPSLQAAYRRRPSASFLLPGTQTSYTGGIAATFQPGCKQMPTGMWKKRRRVYVTKWISGAGDRATPHGPSEWLGTWHGQRGSAPEWISRSGSLWLMNGPCVATVTGWLNDLIECSTAQSLQSFHLNFLQYASNKLLFA